MGFTGVDCAEGLPKVHSLDVEQRLLEEQGVTDYHEAAHLYDHLRGSPGESTAAAAAAASSSAAVAAEGECATLWGKCRKGQAKSPRIFIYSLPGPMVWNDTTDVDFGRTSNIMFLERLLSSEHRVADPEEADYFFIPMIGGNLPDRSGGDNINTPAGRGGPYTSQPPVFRYIHAGGPLHESTPRFQGHTPLTLSWESARGRS